jgi:hypothetical protein
MFMSVLPFYGLTLWPVPLRFIAPRQPFQRAPFPRSMPAFYTLRYAGKPLRESDKKIIDKNT